MQVILRALPRGRCAGVTLRPARAGQAHLSRPDEQGFRWPPYRSRNPRLSASGRAPSIAAAASSTATQGRGSRSDQ